ARDRQFKFLELNPRTSVCSLHPLACGTNFPWLAYLESVGGPLPMPLPDYRVGEVWVFPEVRALRMRRVRVPGRPPPGGPGPEATRRRSPHCATPGRRHSSSSGRWPGTVDGRGADRPDADLPISGAPTMTRGSPCDSRWQPRPSHRTL